MVGWGLGLQVLFALIVVKTAIGMRVFAVAGRARCSQLLDFSVEGSRFVFGPLGDRARLGEGDERRARR